MPLQRSIYLWEPPGVGKSSLVQQLARQQNLELIDLRVTLLDPVLVSNAPLAVSTAIRIDLSRGITPNCRAY
jgi:broad-specificity NMP kinase